MNPEYQDYAGISSDSTRMYAEQISNCSQISEDACNLLTEDINYKLRYIINECLIKSKLQGRECLLSEDVDEAFSELQIDKVYGAPDSPNWSPFRVRQETVYCLEDQKINLIEIAEAPVSVAQEGDIVLDHVWLPNGNDSEDDAGMEEANEAFREYFETMCDAIICDKKKIRHIALIDIATNPHIGPITDWFYNFSYFLLTKDLTYDRLTVRALHLLEVLENSALRSLHIKQKQLKLIVTVLLQRLLKTRIKPDTLKYMCYVLSLLCLRPSLRELVINKLLDKLSALYCTKTGALLNIIYYIGIEAVRRIFLPRIFNFLTLPGDRRTPELTETILAIYGLLCKYNLNIKLIYKMFRAAFDYKLVPYFRSKFDVFCYDIYLDVSRLYDGADHNQEAERDEIRLRSKLIKTRRKVDYRGSYTFRHRIEEVFDIASHICFTERTKLLTLCKKKEPVRTGVSFSIIEPCCTLRKKLQNCNQLYETTRPRKETQITVGKISLLLSVLKQKGTSQCIDHSLHGVII
ncbi:uncharacterized protein LOC126736323 [Anthonomus grandis grandis]|uniref:uncharacterized protein LOC126736323 n=1 Tax=Anthonomus grandis grandis TaxID=2921223 RepID=UPI002166B1FC|nr:uncharacterized protein LOC126736323 [Anthonomus grandis grandis]